MTDKTPADLQEIDRLDPLTSTPAPAESELREYIRLAMVDIDNKLYLTAKDRLGHALKSLERQAAGEGVDLKNAMVNAFALYAGYSADESVALAEFLLGDFDVQKALKARTQGVAVDVEWVRQNINTAEIVDGLVKNTSAPPGHLTRAYFREAVEYLIAQGHLPAPSSEKGEK